MKKKLIEKVVLPNLFKVKGFRFSNKMLFFNNKFAKEIFLILNIFNIK